MASLIDRMTKLYEKMEHSDFTFKVVDPNDESRVTYVRAHKGILTTWSEAFEAMISGNWKEQDEVLIIDSTPEAVNNMVRFQYTNQLHQTDWKHLMDTLLLADKYLLKDLMKACMCALMSKITRNNVLDILRYSSEHNQQAVVTRSVFYIKANWKLMTKTELPETFLNMLDMVHLKALLNSAIQGQPVQWFEFLQIWSSFQCRTNRIDVMPENLRRFLGDLLYMLEYEKMTWEELAEVVLRSGILTADEYAEIGKYKLGLSGTAPFLTKPKFRGKLTHTYLKLFYQSKLCAFRCELEPVEDCVIQILLPYGSPVPLHNDADRHLTKKATLKVKGEKTEIIMTSAKLKSRNQLAYAAYTSCVFLIKDHIYQLYHSSPEQLTSEPERPIEIENILRGKCTAYPSRDNSGFGFALIVNYILS